MRRPTLRVISNPHWKPEPTTIPVHTLPETAGPRHFGRVDDSGWFRSDGEELGESMPLTALAWGVRDMIWESYQDGWLNDHDIRNWASGEGALVILLDRLCVSWVAKVDPDDMLLIAQGFDVKDILPGVLPGRRPADWLLQLQWKPWLAQFDELREALTPYIENHFRK